MEDIEETLKINNMTKEKNTKEGGGGGIRYRWTVTENTLLNIKKRSSFKTKTKRGPYNKTKDKLHKIDIIPVHLHSIYLSICLSICSSILIHSFCSAHCAKSEIQFNEQKTIYEAQNNSASFNIQLISERSECVLYFFLAGMFSV